MRRRAPRAHRIVAAVGAVVALALGLGAAAALELPIFALWGLALAGAWAFIAWRGGVAGWPALIVAGRLVFVLAIAVALLARLLDDHGWALDAVIRESLPSLELPYLGRAIVALRTAMFLGALGGLLILAGHRFRGRP